MSRVLFAGLLALATTALADGAPSATDWSLSRMMEDPVGFPRQREASGTAWQPDLTPMYGEHLMPGGGWMVMIHYSVFAGWGAQTGARADGRPLSQNWVMGMADHDLLGGRFSARAMLTAEPWTAGGRGVPLLLQTGETWLDIPLHDVQHPHDLFMELSLSYARALAGGFGFQLYVAPVGEPALGPPAFMHRFSASADPLPPISHHWQDSTHVTFGVITAGVYSRWFKLEGSIFNGREPDENRLNFDFGPLDAYSLRLQVAPAPWLSLQVSYGHLRQPERLYPLNDLDRLTASAMVGAPYGDQGAWAVTFAWGHNIGTREPVTNAFVLEGLIDLDGSNTVFARAETAQKFGHDLVLEFDPQWFNERFQVFALAAGYARDLVTLGPVVVGVGGRVALNVVPRELVPYYGGATPIGGEVFLRLHPPRMVGEASRLGQALDGP